MNRGNPWSQLPIESFGTLIAPSLLAVDFTRMGSQVDMVLSVGVKVLHVDIMDGHFVPNLSMGPPVVASLRKYTDASLDVHLMVTNPENFIDPFAEAGADSLNFHVEAVSDPVPLINRIRDLGLGVAVTLKPETPAEAVGPVAELVDMVLVMTVQPGFGGQKFLDDMLPKIRNLRGMLSDNQRIEVDGGISPETALLCKKAGADVFVAGSDVFASEDPALAVAALRDAVAKGT